MATAPVLDQSQGDHLAVADATGTIREWIAPAPPATQAQRLLEGPGWLAMRLGSDVALLLLALAAAWLGAPAGGVDPVAGWLTWLFPPLTLGLLAVRGTYKRTIQIRVLDGIGPVLGATSLAAMTLIALAAIGYGSEQIAPLTARLWVFANLYLVAGRLLLAVSQRRARTNRVVGKPTLIIGAGKVGAQVEHRLQEQPELGLRTVGYLDVNPPPAELVPERRAPVLGAPADLPAVAAATGAQHVIFAFQSNRGADSQMLPIVRCCAALRLEASLVPRLFESINVRVGLEHIGGMPLFRLRSIDPAGWQFGLKYAIDRVLGTMLLVMIAPFLLTLAAAVRLSSPGPILFRQRRIGRDGHAFDILKFRSMQVTEAEGDASVGASMIAGIAPGGVEGADRRTRIGAFLRRTSLDELPQLLNVAKGDMSLVGPRPERPRFVELFREEVYRYEDRHRVKSGITGWAQVHRLRGKSSLKDRVEWDNYYIENWSLMLDLKILVMTVAALFHRVE